MLISRKFYIFSIRKNFSLFHIVLWSERMGLCTFTILYKHQSSDLSNFFKSSKAKHVAQICALELHYCSLFMLCTQFRCFITPTKFEKFSGLRFSVKSKLHNFTKINVQSFIRTTNHPKLISRKI